MMLDLARKEVSERSEMFSTDLESSHISTGFTAPSSTATQPRPRSA